METAENSSLAYDILVIGGGVAGLLAACRARQAGKRVLLVEKLSFLGGRFSAFPYQGAEISSGAFHTIPHGDEGPFAQALRRSGVDVAITRPAVFAAFYRQGRQFTARSALEAIQMFDRPADRRMIWRAFIHLTLHPHFPGSVADWLNHLGASREVRSLFDRFCQFALSTGMDQVPYREGRAIAKAVLRFGLPGVPAGGAREVIQRLSQVMVQEGVAIWKTAQVERLLFDGSKICGAVVHLRRSGRRVQVFAPTVVSAIGPQPTLRLVEQSGGELPAAGSLRLISPATGLKIHVLSPISLLDHPAILFCLDTQRIAGVIQVTNTDPSLAPPGKHLLISHQALQPGANWQEEMEIALQDWRDVFGSAFDRCTVLGSSRFPEDYPVNWAAQGMDLRQQPFARQGLWLVGDGVKPEGLMMVEGAAASAESAIQQILGCPDTTPWLPSRSVQLFTLVRRFIKSLSSSKERK